MGPAHSGQMGNRNGSMRATPEGVPIDEALRLANFRHLSARGAPWFAIKDSQQPMRRTT